MKGLTVMENNSQKQALLQIGKLLSEFLKHLAGDHSDEWLQAFKKFLRKENPWEERGKNNNPKTKTPKWETDALAKVSKEKESLEKGIKATMLADFIRSENYETTRSTQDFYCRIARSGDYGDTVGFGILLGKRTYLCDPIPFLRRRRPFLGCFFFREENWRFEVYGERNMPIVKELCEKISKRFEKEINIVLVTIQYEEESFWREAPEYAY